GAEQRAEQEVDRRIAVLEIPALQARCGAEIGCRTLLGEEHLDEDDGNEREVDSLLPDSQPGIDAAERQDVEEEAGDEECDSEPALVAGVVEAQPLEGARRDTRRVWGCGGGGFVGGHSLWVFRGGGA